MNFAKLLSAGVQYVKLYMGQVRLPYRSTEVRLYVGHLRFGLVRSPYVGQLTSG